VFDEATSALDNATEAAVMEAIAELQGSKTVILIAHRLTTVVHANAIFVFENGQVQSTGTYAELLLNSASFKELATHSSS